MDAELIFLETLSDIRNKIQDAFLDPVHYELFDETKRYDLIKACGLLRQLFLDDDNLVNAVNKKYKVPIIFKIRDYRKTLPTDYNALWFSILPVGYDRDNLKIKLKEFLQITPLIYLNHVYSIKNIIKISSHVLGGIHLRATKDEMEKAFFDQNNLEVGIKNGVYMSIHSICKVCLDTLEPLQNIIKEAQTPTGGV